MVKPDLNTTLPVRQTASIFKQPVTKVTNHPSNKVKTDSHKAVDQPRQLFWERKLSGLSAFEIAEELVKTMDLPRGLKGVGPLCSDKTLLSAISSALPQPCHWSAEHSCGEEPCGMAQRRSARPSWLPMTTSGRVHINLVVGHNNTQLLWGLVVNPAKRTVLNHCSLTPLPLCGVCRKQEDLVHNVRRLEEHSDGGHVGSHRNPPIRQML
uniref:Methyl-CpG binding domain protein 3 n=1 Tax=Oncorhynchus tshawytscha TaxID=74940 RepID=A0A8C8JYV7_ONCTS